MQSVAFSVPIQGGGVVALTHNFSDDLAVDNYSALVIDRPKQLRVLLVTAGNAYVVKALAAANAAAPRVMSPQGYEDLGPQDVIRNGREDVDGYDLLVFDRYTPSKIPLVNSLYFGVAPPIDMLKRLPTAENEPAEQVVLDWQRDDDLMRYVAMDDVVLLEPGRLALPDHAQILATGQTGPIIASINDEGVYHVVVGFDVLKSNWPMQLSFAVFIENVVQTLGSIQHVQSYQPGQVAQIQVPAELSSISYSAAAGLGSGAESFEARVERGRAVLPIFDRAGLFVAKGNLPEPNGHIAVNLHDEAESNLHAAAVLRVGANAVAAEPGLTGASTEIWRWFILAGLAFLMLEWLIYTRRMHL